jgi:glycine/D-amino acid oxidase-like deaminating enzyme
MWLAGLDDDLTPRPSLEGDRSADVAIVGGGYTGLWTGYYLKKADPSLDVVVVEKEICGFGASGRNGGWCSAAFATDVSRLARAYGRAAAVRMQQAMFDTVDEVGRVVQSEGIDASWAKGGTLTFATAPAHVPRLHAQLHEKRSFGFTEDDYRWLEPREAAEHIRVARNWGAAYTPHCAALDPARLARGLAEAAERAGVRIYEQTAAVSVENRTVKTDKGAVAADVVVRATEGYTRALKGMKRRLVPIYSLMIGTEPLPEDAWERIGWERRETMTDGRHLIIYGQRTADGRIAFGGRGAPYHFASRIKDGFDREPRVFDELRRTLRSLFPALERAAIVHEWGGCLGVPRDWHPSAGYDAGSGFAWAGGYVGDGVATANLAGRTLADLIAGQHTDLVTLPWVGHVSPQWEPEPLRWLGVNFALRAGRSADGAEARTGRPARRADLIGRLQTGRPV